jgi:tRNA A-37 threonylcarbamoyl transferase component Bud32
VVAEPKLRKIAEGREAEMFEWEDGTILRLGRGENAEAQVNWQELTLKQAESCGIRVPKVYGRMEVMGWPGLIMERVPGVDLLTLVGQKPWKVLQVAGICARVHVQMHEAVAPLEVEPLKGRIGRLVTTSERVPDDVREFVLAELQKLPDGGRLCHGDFHAGNIMMNGDEPVVIDWPAISRGDPDADVARSWMMHQFGALPPGTSVMLKVMAAVGRRLLVDSYVRAYRRERSLDMRQVRRWAHVRAGDRLTEGIEEERPALLEFVRKGIAAK